MFDGRPPPCSVVQRVRSVMALKRNTARAYTAGFLISVALAVPMALAPDLPASAASAPKPPGLLQQFFSIFAPASPVTQPRLPAIVTNRPSNAPADVTARHVSNRDNPMYPYAGGSQDNGAKHSLSYRTVCVRLCDGYYWPISESAPMSRFRGDNATCESSCQQPAKLFYQPIGDSDAGQLVGLDGKAYSSIDKAFAYRKSLNPSCRCKPDPWSSSEVQRHEDYAAAEAAARAQLAAMAPAESGDGVGPEPVVAAADGAIAANAATLPAAPVVMIPAKPKRKTAPQVAAAAIAAMTAPATAAASGFALKPANGVSQRYVPLR